MWPKIQLGKLQTTCRPNSRPQTEAFGKTTEGAQAVHRAQASVLHGGAALQVRRCEKICFDVQSETLHAGTGGRCFAPLF